MELRVAGIQMDVTKNVQQNVETICRTVQKASSASADILLTPEGSLSGYTPDFNQAEVEAGLAEVTSLAARLHIGLALGTCFKEMDGLTYNQIRFYSPQGIYLGSHSKILRCGSMTTPSVGEINDYATTELRIFPFEDFLIGGLICNDMWANPSCTPMPDPHLSQQLAQLGARIIFHAVNGGRDGSQWSTEVAWHFHESNLRIRSESGQVWIVTVDNSNPSSLPCSSPGGVINPQGEWVCRVDSLGEQFFVHTISSLPASKPGS